MAKNINDFNKLNDKEKQEYEASIRQFYKILIVATFFFYLIPFIIILACGKNGKVAALILEFLLFNIFTLFSFIANFLHSKIHGFKIMVPLGISIYFIPVAFIYYTPVVISYALMYFILGMFGQLTGFLMLRRKKSKRQPLGLNNLVNKKVSKPKKKSKK